ncbi:MAG: GAF domain-containing protein, partial [Anaerolineae bacterium]|nr:GAF domain-containing protein [Anaerolineae bacterium]
PLRARGVVIGAMTVQSAQAAAFDEADIAVMQTVADQVATAISNARLFGQVQVSLDAERRAYGELSREAWQALLLEQPDLGFVEDGGGLAPAGETWDAEMSEAVRSGKPASGGDRALAVPIVARDQVVAVIDAHLPDGTGAWSAEQREMLQALAEQLGVALEGGRLYRETQRRALREQIIGQVTGRIRESLDLETMLRTATGEIRQALNLGDLVIRLATPRQSAQDGGKQE